MINLNNLRGQQIWIDSYRFDVDDNLDVKAYQKQDSGSEIQVDAINSISKVARKVHFKNLDNENSIHEIMLYPLYCIFILQKITDYKALPSKI